MNRPARDLTRITLSLLTVLSLAATVPLTSCTRDASSTAKPPAFQAVERQTQTVSEDIGRLVPEDAVVFAHVSSLSGLEAKVKDLVKSFKPGAENMVGLNMMYGFVGLREKDFDTSKPAGVALKMGQMGPQPILILPAISPSDVADIAEAPVVISGSYVGVAKGATASLADTASPLGNDLPTGDVAVRVRLDQILAPFRPKIDQFLDPEMLLAMNPAQQTAASKAGLEFVVNWVKQLLDHAKTLEVGMSLNDGKLDLGFVFKVAQGSAMDVGPAKTDRNLPYLAGSLPIPDASVVYLLSGFSTWQDTFEPMYKTMAADMPDKEAQQFLAFTKKSTELYKHMHDDMVMAMDFTPKGLQAVALMRAKDSTAFQADWDKYIDDYMKVMNSGALGTQGMRFTKAEPLEISGVNFNIFTLEVDFAAMMEAQGTPLPEDALDRMTAVFDLVLGKGGLKIGMGLDGNNIMLLMGNIQELGTKTVAAIRQGKRYKLATLDKVAEQLHLNPSFLLSMDIRRITSSMISIMPKEFRDQAPAVPQGAPIQVWFACAANGPVYELQAHVDLAGIAAMVREMTSSK